MNISVIIALWLISEYIVILWLIYEYTNFDIDFWIYNIKLCWANLEIQKNMYLDYLWLVKQIVEKNELLSQTVSSSHLFVLIYLILNKIHVKPRSQASKYKDTSFFSVEFYYQKNLTPKKTWFLFTLVYKAKTQFQIGENESLLLSQITKTSHTHISTIRL